MYDRIIEYGLYKIEQPYEDIIEKIFFENIKSIINSDSQKEEMVKQRNCEEYKIWRNAVLIRDNFICQKCKRSKNETTLNVHHIKPFSKYPDLRFVIENGITLCSDCHKKIHSKKRSN